MGVVWAWLLVSLPIKAAPARPTDLQLRSTVGLPETRYFFWMALAIMQLSIVCPTTPMTGMGGGGVGIRQLGKCNCPTPWAVIESNPPINIPPSSKYQLSNCSDH